MSDAGWSVPKRSAPTAGDLRRWVRGCLGGLLGLVSCEELQADAFIVLAGNVSLGVLTRREGLYVFTAQGPALAGLDGRIFGTAEEARQAVADACAGGRTQGAVALQPVWYS